MIYQIDTGFACAGIVVKDNRVIDAAPIFRWMKGKTLDQVKRWGKIITIVPVC